MSFIETKKTQTTEKTRRKGTRKNNCNQTAKNRYHQKSSTSKCECWVDFGGRDKGIINESGENTGKRTTTAQNPNKQPSYRHNDGKTKLEK